MRTETNRLFTWLALGAVAYHAMTMVLLHWFAPEVNPQTDMVSAYLSSPYHWLARSTFLALGCTMAFVGLGLSGRLASSFLLKVSAGLLVVAIVGFIGVSVAPQAARFFGIPTQPATVLSILLLSIVLRREAPWRATGTLLVLIGFSLVLLFALTILTGLLTSMGLGGVANRVVLVLIYSWVVLVARGLLWGSEGSGVDAA